MRDHIELCEDAYIQKWYTVSDHYVPLVQASHIWSKVLYQEAEKDARPMSRPFQG